METLVSTIGIILLIAVTICGVAGWWPFSSRSQSPAPQQGATGTTGNATQQGTNPPAPTPPAAQVVEGDGHDEKKRGWGCLAIIAVVTSILLLILHGMQCSYHGLKEAAREYEQAVEKGSQTLSNHYWFWWLQDPDKPAPVDKGQYMTVTENSEAAIACHYPEEGCKTYRKFSARLGVNPEIGRIVGGEAGKDGTFPITGRFQVVTRKPGTLEPISYLVWYDKNPDPDIVIGKAYLLTMKIGNWK